MATHRSRKDYIAALEKRVADLSLAIEEIESKRRSEPEGEHPSQKYIDELKFELRSYRVKLEVQLSGDEKTSGGDVDNRVVFLSRFRGKESSNP